MNRRDAKRAACERAASALETALAGGWEVLDGYGEEGREKVEAALAELIGELERRGGGAPGLDLELLYGTDDGRPPADGREPT